MDGLVFHDGLAAAAGRYRPLDAAQLALLPAVSGRTWGYYTVPPAMKDGSPRDFDASAVGPVYVDPYEPDGGVVFDPRAVTAADLAAAVAAASHPYQVYCRFGRPAGRARATPDGGVPARPARDVLSPRAVRPGVTRGTAPGKTVMSDEPTPPVPPAPPAVPSPPPAAAAAPAVPADASTAAVLRAVVEVQQQLVELLRDGRSGRRTPAPEPAEAAAADDDDRLAAAFGTLGLPFVTGPTPHKARRPVVFEIPGAGRHMARYHDVIEGGGCVVLVYDTRYEDGQQYVPPELDENTPITLHVQGDRPEQRRTYRVASLGLNYAFGAFDHIVLVRLDDGHPYDEH